MCEEKKTELLCVRTAFMTCYFEKLVIAVNRNLCGYYVIDIQTSTWDWNHPIFRAGSLLPEVVLPSNLLLRRLVLLL